MSENLWQNNRKTNVQIPPGLNVLIVCCGEQTEPNYFNAIFKNIKKKYRVKSRGITEFKYKIIIDAVDPLKMSQNLKKRINSKKNPYDEIWVVFDKDSFPADRFDNAIESINSKVSQHALWSNQCIELWFVLHFEYLQSQLNRKDYSKHLSKYLKKKYEKNDEFIYNEILKSGGKITFAINNAKKLFKKHSNIKSYSKKEPATNVVEFFESYKEYI